MELTTDQLCIILAVDVVVMVAMMIGMFFYLKEGDDQ